MVYPGSTDWQNQEASPKGRIVSVSFHHHAYKLAAGCQRPWLPLRAQTFTDWEHILVDDGSTDGSLAIGDLAVAQDERFRSLPTSHKGCLAVLRNLALDVARGRYIAFIDADDLWLPEKLARSVDWMATHGHGFIYHDYRRFFRADGGVVGSLPARRDRDCVFSIHAGVSIVWVWSIDRELIPEFRFHEGLYPYHHEDFIPG